MLIVMRAVVRFSAIGCGLEFVRKCGRPLLPGEMPLLGELDGKRERLGLPRLGKYRSASVARQARQSGQAFRIGRGIMPAQGSHRTMRETRDPAPWRGRPP